MKKYNGHERMLLLLSVMPFYFCYLFPDILIYLIVFQVDLTRFVDIFREKVRRFLEKTILSILRQISNKPVIKLKIIH